MKRVLQAIVVVSLLSAAAFAAYYGTRHSQLSRSPNEADHITLYENGIAAVRLQRSFESDGGPQILDFLLPTTTIFDSIRVQGEDVAVQELRSSLAADSGLHPGDALVVHMDEGSKHEGTLLKDDGSSLWLSAASGTILIERNHVSAVEVKGRQVDPSAPGATAVGVMVQSPSGRRDVTVSYLAQGAGWSPDFLLDAKTGSMTFFATLKGLSDWENVTLDLVAGRPNMVYYPGASRMDLDSSFIAAGTGGGVTSTGTYAPNVQSSQLGDLRKYHYNGVVTLHQAEAVRLPMATGHVDVVRHSYQARANPNQGDWASMSEVYQIRNAMSEPLPAGQVKVFLDDEWIGSDNLPALGKGELGNVTVSSSGEVKWRTVAEQEAHSEPRAGDYGRKVETVTTTYDIQLRNLRSDRIDTRASFEASGYRTTLARMDPTPDEVHGATQVWNGPVEAGATTHHRITLQVDRDL